MSRTWIAPTQEEYMKEQAQFLHVYWDHLRRTGEATTAAKACEEFVRRFAEPFRRKHGPKAGKAN